jgi:CspA family cold shock protein
MLNGKVKVFKEDKGYGFIIDNNSNEEIFVHVSGLVDKVDAGDAVTYDIVDGRKGKNAVNVKRA